MIVKIKFKNANNEEFTMLFGDSYKKWFIQFQEYAYRFCELEIISVDISKSEWKGWGGLKWCNENEFQEELNREGVQSNETDNPKPRVYSKMNFYFSKSISEKALSIMVLENKKRTK